MAHQNGTANDPVDLLDKLRIFAAANGWTIHNFGARPAGATAGQALQLSKAQLSATFVTLSAAGTVFNPGPMVGSYVHDAYVSGSGTENQANGSPISYTNGMAGPYQAYDFFTGQGANGPYLYAVVETSAGLFKHFGIGVLDAIGTLLPGTFNVNSNWQHATSYVSNIASGAHSIPWQGSETSNPNGFNNNGAAYSGIQIRADADTLSPKWYLSTRQNGASNVYVPRRMVGGPIYSAPSTPEQVTLALQTSSASQRTGRTTLVPTLMLGERTGGQYSPLGSGPGVRWVQLDYLDPGAVLTIGTDQWKVFPVARKNGTGGAPNSQLYGFAYKMT